MGSLDMVGKCLNDLQLHGVEAVNMMKLSGACKQTTRGDRPCLQSSRCLEGAMEVEDDID